MLYQEYKEIFEEILELSIELENLFKHHKLDEVEEVFNKRDVLFQKLSTPSDIDEEKINYIRKLRDTIQEKNDYIMRAMQVVKSEIKKALLENVQDEKLINAYKIPKTNNAASIFDSLE